MNKDELLEKAADLLQNARDDDYGCHQLGVTWHELSREWLRQFDAAKDASDARPMKSVWNSAALDISDSDSAGEPR